MRKENERGRNAKENGKRRRKENERERNAKGNGKRRRKEKRVI